jgi:NADH:ubiquinone oxidoreductase subunit D
MRKVDGYGFIQFQIPGAAGDHGDTYDRMMRALEMRESV